MDANLLREPLQRALRLMDDSSLSLDFITEEALADFQEVLNSAGQTDLLNASETA